MRRIIIVAAAALVAGGAGTGAVYASSQSDSSPTTPNVSNDQPPDLSRILYGEEAAKNDSGAVEIHDWQHGQVTSVSGSTMTVRSSDGTTWTWTLGTDAQTKAEAEAGTKVKTGDDILVSGSRDGTTSTTRTADHVDDPPPDFSNLRKNLQNLKDRMNRLHQDLQRDLPDAPG